MAALPPLVLIKGPEDLLIDRAVEQVVESARALVPRISRVNRSSRRSHRPSRSASTVASASARGSS